MPKMTAKYSTALQYARMRGLPTDGNQEALYQRLNKAGFMWDSSSQEWLELASEPADPPTPLVMVRVWANAETVEAMADMVQEFMAESDFTPVKRNGPYLCRPPKQLEARMYLEFMPPKGGR
jgi:hypothetical protein